MNLVREMDKKLKTEVCVVYEATGVYHRVLKKVLEDNNIKQFIINPLLSAKTRKNDSLRCPKTDKLDPKSIANLIPSFPFRSVPCQNHYRRPRGQTVKRAEDKRFSRLLRYVHGVVISSMKNILQEV